MATIAATWRRTNGDRDDDASQHDSFSLANIIPQKHNDNAGLWAAIEEVTRASAVSDGEVYVVTGPFYQGPEIQVLITGALSAVGRFAVFAASEIGAKAIAAFAARSSTLPAALWRERSDRHRR